MKINLTWRIWILLIVVALSLLAVFGSPLNFFQKGVLVTSVEQNSTIFDQGLKKGQIITEIDGQKIESLEDYLKIIQSKFDFNESVKTILKTKDSEIILFSKNPPQITVSEIPKTNIKTGLDISWGSRALVKAQEIKLSSLDADDLKRIIKNRLNVYGIEDVKITKISDFSGDYYIRIEIAGTTPEDLKNLISQQGKFEAKIGNKTVFIGGKKDVTSVTRSGQDAVIESCQESNGFYFCNFRFTIFLSEDAAKRHAEITGELDVNSTLDGNYLSERLDLFLDDRLVDSLLISEGLKGRVTTQISISGSGTGETQEEANENARNEMNNLQTILITGSLPYKLEIVKLDTISPNLGNEFIRTILIAGLASLGIVVIIIFGRYRKVKASLALLVTSLSEVLIILGIASMIGWNIDLPGIAGILAAIGTGIDQQIIILDEGRQDLELSINKRLKRARGIILGAYFTAVVALLPLLWVGAGLLKGFAVTTIIGITVGVLITRPAFTEMVKRFEE